MNISTLVIKLGRDFEAMTGRLALVVTAMVFGLICTIAITLTYVTLSRDISTAYTDTVPASGILDIGQVDEALLAKVRAMEGVAAAEALSIIHTRTKAPNGQFGRGMLFVSEYPFQQQIGLVRVEQSIDVPFPFVKLERQSLAIAQTNIGGVVALELPGIGFVDLNVSGTVFDPSLAPAEQEQAVYTYMDRSTWRALGGGPLEMIEVRVTGDVADQEHVDATLSKVANALRSQGVNVHLVQIPPAQTHPHQTQMTTVLSLFLAFGLIAFLLSGFLVSVTIDGLMVQQVQQIAIMKAVGGRAGQIRAIYLLGVLLLGMVALAVALPIGMIISSNLSGAISSLLNFDLTTTSPTIALWIFWVFIGLFIPAAFALVPLTRATKMSVMAAMSDQGIDRVSRVPQFIIDFWGRGVARLALAGVSRKLMRSFLIMGLLAAAGVVTLTARNIAQSYQTSVQYSAADRRHDIDITLASPLSFGDAKTLVLATEATTTSLAYVQEIALARKDGLAVIRTYPDGGHGSITVFALKDAQSIAHLKVLDGELTNSFSAGVVVNQSAHSLLNKPEIGTQLSLSLDGEIVSAPLAGVVQQYLSPATAYMSLNDLEAQIGSIGVNSIRLSALKISQIGATIDSRARAFGSSVASVVTEDLMDKAVSGHVAILVFLLAALGAMIAVVGFTGLAAAQGISVVERSREFGVLRAIGSSNRQVLFTLLIEGTIYWVGALLFAFALSLPFTAYFNSVIGVMSFGLALPMSIDWPAIIIWGVVSLGGTLIASLPPGFAAMRSTVNTTLNH